MCPPAKIITISADPIASGAIGLDGLSFAVAVPIVKTKMNAPASLRLNAVTCASGSKGSGLRCSTRSASNLQPHGEDRDSHVPAVRGHVRADDHGRRRPG